MPASAAPQPDSPAARPGGAAQRLAEALQHSDVLVALYDGQDALQWANTAFDACYGSSSGRQPPPVPVRSQDATRRQELRLPDGRRLWASESVLPDGWLLWMASDVSALSPLPAGDSGFIELAGDRSQPPPVLQLAAAAVQEARRKNRFLSVALVSLETPAEAVETGLRHFAAHGQRHLRPGDRAGRFDDQRLLLLLPGAALHAAAIIVQRLRQAMPPLPGAKPQPCRFSVGLAQLEDGEELALLLRRAERALQSAQGRGGNHTVLDRA